MNQTQSTHDSFKSPVKFNSMVAVKGIPTKAKAKSKSTLWQKFLFGRRIVCFVAGAVYYIFGVQVTVQMGLLVNGFEKLVHIYTLDDSVRMRKWIGTTTIRQSPLVQQALGNLTQPLDRTLYLRQDALSTFQPCPGLPSRQQEIYGDSWLRSLYSAVIAGTSYNLTFLTDKELVAPVVDCTSAFIATNDTTRSKFYFLTRDVANHDNVHVLTLALSIQEYWIYNETQIGSAAVASLTSISDLQSDQVDYHFILSLGYPYFEFDFQAYEFVSSDASNNQQFRSVPRNQANELSKMVETTYKSGFYYKSATEHFNFKQQNWLLESTPMEAISTWRWKTKSFIKNTWAWVHIFDTAIAFFMFGHMIQLFLVFYRTMKEGKLWAGDLTMPMAKPFMMRGLVVFLFWFITGFWELTEFCLQDAHQITSLDTIYSFTELMRYDLSHVVATYAALLGKATKERIDGGIQYGIFLTCFIFRGYIIQLSPSLIASIKDLAAQNAQLELKSSILSPMQLRVPYAIEQYPVRLMLYVLLPTLPIVPLVVLFVIIRKIYWHYSPKMIPVQRTNGSSAASDPRDAMTLQKSAFTQFELATGARLENMYGLFSDYDNYIIIKGMMFASADGIYAAGFLIANKKYLVQVNDIWDILLMKLIRVRHKNLYIFKMSGTTVQQTALLVYPETITMQDLLYLGTSILS